MSEAVWLCRVPLPALGEPPISSAAVLPASGLVACGCPQGCVKATLICRVLYGWVQQQLQHAPGAMGAATQVSAAAVPAVVTAARVGVPVPQNHPGLLCRGGNVPCQCCGTARAVLVVKPWRYLLLLEKSPCQPTRGSEETSRGFRCQPAAVSAGGVPEILPSTGLFV